MVLCLLEADLFMRASDIFIANIKIHFKLQFVSQEYDYSTYALKLFHISK